MTEAGQGHKKFHEGTSSGQVSKSHDATLIPPAYTNPPLAVNQSEPGPGTIQKAALRLVSDAPDTRSKTASTGTVPIGRVSKGKRKTSAIKNASKLAIAETTYQAQKAWRVSMGQKGKNLLSFRVRPATSGYRVTWRHGNHESYVCYLSAQKWQALRKQPSTPSFTRTITERVGERIANGDVEAGKLDGLLERLREFC